MDARGFATIIGTRWAITAMAVAIAAGGCAPPAAPPPGQQAQSQGAARRIQHTLPIHVESVAQGEMHRVGQNVREHDLAVSDDSPGNAVDLGPPEEVAAYWGTRIAAADQRVRAIAANGGLYAARKPIFELVSPRFKWHVMYMMGMDDEAEFSRAVSELSPLGLGTVDRVPHPYGDERIRRVHRPGRRLRALRIAGRPTGVLARGG